MGAFIQELFRAGIYKRTQGRIARQATFAALAAVVSMGAWSLSNYCSGINFRDPDTGQSNEVAYHIYVYALPLVFLLAGLWASFRTVQLPNFADFLITVEGEMNKVSWPSRGELFRASIVVMFVIFFLAGVLFVYDLGLRELLGGIGWVLELVF